MHVRCSTGFVATLESRGEYSIVPGSFSLYALSESTLHDSSSHTAGHEGGHLFRRWPSHTYLLCLSRTSPLPSRRLPFLARSLGPLSLCNEQACALISASYASPYRASATVDSLKDALLFWGRLLTAWSLPLPILTAISVGSLVRTSFGGGVGRIGRFLRPGRRRRERRVLAESRPMVRFSVVTFNVRAIMDRWPERLPILRACLQQMSPDVVAFQEVLTGEFGQDVMLIGRDYQVYACRAALENLLETGGAHRHFANFFTTLLSWQPTRQLLVALPLWVETAREKYCLEWDWLRTLRDVLMAPFFGNSVATRLSSQEVSDIQHDTLVLGNFRAAHRLSISVKEAGAETGFKVWIVNCHLDHDLPDTRVQQATEVCRWMETQKAGYAAVVLCGDLNAAPGEAVHDVFEELGYMSAHKALKGHEPPVTWPTGIQAPFAEGGSPDCLDYIYIWQAEGYVCRAVAAEVWGNEPAEHDHTLYPSDHAGLKVTVEVQQVPAIA